MNMTNEELNSVSSEDIIDSEQDYVQAINDLKSNTVSKEQYQKLRSENKKLLDALVNGQQIETPKEEKADIAELRKKLFNKDGNLSNLEYVETTLQLRNALIENGDTDPFLPYGDKVDITNDMRDKADRVAEALQECVDFADGDSGIFTAQLQRITKDVLPGRRAR